jgi:predicted unusual protein kinase regulating ubiquinone biosynthesis (AarF/ABC1/UbiB family)
VKNPQRDSLQERLRAGLLGSEAEVTTSSLRRLWRSGRHLGGLLLGSAELDEKQLAKLVGTLGELKGVAMKAGQMLGYVDAGLPPEVRAALSLLQTAAPTTPLPIVKRILVASGAADQLAWLEPIPLAAASIGQVHRGRLSDGTEVAVKVRHPDIEKALAADFRSAAVGAVLGRAMGGATVPDLIGEARTAFLEECDFALEGRRQERFRALHAGDPVVIVPEVVWSAPDVLVSRFCAGRGLDAFLADNPSQAERDRMGEALFRFWMASLYREGLFHGDPHPGNFAFTSDGKLVIYDFGCVREFAPAQRRAFADLAAATRADDPAALADAFTRLGGRAPRDAQSLANLRRWMRGFFGPLLQPGRRRIAPDEGVDARRVMRDKRAILALQPPGRMLFLFRLRFGLYAVLSRLAAEVDWCALESELARDA